MRGSHFGRYALCSCVAAAMLAGCGGNANNVTPSGVPNSSLPYHKTFNYTGGAQHFKVPAGVTHITVVALGAHGAGSPEAYGGRVYAVIPVTPGENLVVYIGGNGSGVTGGFNGGGDGGDERNSAGFGGGGASDVREHGDSLKNRVLVAGGGGGKGGEVLPNDESRRFIGGRGGAGGGSIGGQGQNGWPSLHSFYGLGGYGGGGGSQSIGGAGRSGGGGGGLGNPGFPGLFGVGGDGGQGCRNSYCVPGCSGAGGGGGYYGGGGGGVGGSNSSYAWGGGGGGGGSSYAERKATDVRFWQGWKKSAHNSLVVFSW
jgi:hypothetical protein